MILSRNVKLLTRNGLKDYKKPNLRFYLNDTLLTKTCDYKNTTTSLTLYNISTKDSCFKLFDEGEILTSKGFVSIKDLQVGDTLIVHTLRQTDYGASSITLCERNITEISKVVTERDCIEVPYNELIVDGLYLKNT